MLSPVMVERALENAIRKTGPDWFVNEDNVEEIVTDSVAPVSRYGDPLFTIEKCEPQVHVRETPEGFKVDLQVLLHIKVNTDRIDMSPSSGIGREWP